MIVLPGRLDPPADRLLAALAARGERVLGPGELPGGDDPVTLAISTGPFVFDFASLVGSLGARPFRVLLLSRIGAHPDAVAPSLKRLWRLEEHVRGGGVPTLTLRLGALVGPGAPLWNRLRSRPALPRGGRMLLNPALEADAVESIARALAESEPWHDWFEVAGPEVWSLAELRDLAVALPAAHDAGAWVPSLEEMAEHRLADCEPWCSRFGIAPGSLAARLRERAA